MTLFRLWFPIAFVVSGFVVGCVKADRTQNNDLVRLQKYSISKSLIQYNNRAQFETGNIELEDIKFSNTEDGTRWKQVDSVQLFLRLCQIRDRATQGTIRYERFHIKSELGADIAWTRNGEVAKDANVKSHVHNPITVNSGNCMRWTQTVPVFNYLAPSVNIALHYEIESLNGNLGKIVKRIGFNPWDMYRNKNKSRGFFDLTDFDSSEWHSGDWVYGEREVIEALQGYPWPKNKPKVKLQIKPPAILPSPQDREMVERFHKQLSKLDDKERDKRLRARNEHLRSKDLKMKIDFTTTPFVTVNDSTGNPHVQELLSGRFKVYMNVIGTGIDPGSGKRYRLAEDIPTSNGEKTDGVGPDGKRIVNNSHLEYEATTNGLIASVPMFLRADTEYGMVKLAVKIVPLDMEGVEPFQAIYTLGPHDQWMKRQVPTFDTNLSVAMDEIDYDNYIAESPLIDPDFYTAARPAELFYFRKLEARFMRVMPGETATDRTVMYSVKSCVDDGFWGTGAGRGLQFQVTTHDPGHPDHVMVRQTNEDGCLTWFGFISHKYYRKEVLFRKKADVQFIGNTEGENRYGKMVNEFSKDFTYYMNPWDDKFTFSWDERDMPADYHEVIRGEREYALESKLFIADFKYMTMGFRYEIDEHLNLKVKKSILLVMHPYVLKYNSIILGRRGTEKLRDGIYLMKVALQKDYLDPATKGVRIYDCNNSVAVELSNSVEVRPYNEADDVGPEDLHIYDMFNSAHENIQLSKDKEICASAEIVDDPSKPEETKLKDGAPLTTEAITESNDEELRRSMKQYISVQTKLVRVQGGMIITPVEFEVDDLRLMRIRNQFFVQLQTIDERKLRLAALMNEGLGDIKIGDIEEGSLQKQYLDIYATLGESGSITDNDFNEMLSEYIEKRDLADAMTQLNQAGFDVNATEEMLLKAVNADDLDVNSDEYKELLESVRHKILRLAQYKMTGQNAQSAFRNDKEALINQIMRQAADFNQDQLNKKVEALRSEDKSELSDDPLLTDFLVGRDFLSTEEIVVRIINKRIEDAIRAGDSDQEKVLKSLQVADFTQIPLTPSFDFNLITNHGIHGPDRGKIGIREGDVELEDDGLSGLDTRTFVGPLTFVFNTNSSALRPTDTLEEEDCGNAFCDLKGYATNALNEEIDSALDIENKNGLINDLTAKVRTMGDTVNAYQRDKFYGYLGDYANKTVDELIEEKVEIDEENQWKMKLGSQIWNFVRSMDLKYVLLNDSAKNKDSRLKMVNYKRCVNLSSHELEDPANGCLVETRSGPDVIQTTTFYKQLNQRKYRFPELDPDYSEPLSKEEQDRLDELENQVQHPYSFSGYNAKSLLEKYYDLYDEEISPQEVEGILETDTYTLMNEATNEGTISIDKAMENNPKLVEELKMRRGFYHRMCFVLAQNFFKEKFFHKGTKKRRQRARRRYKKSVSQMERQCHEAVSKMYTDFDEYGFDVKGIRDNFKRTNDYVVPQPTISDFEPIVFERKARVYETTGEYVYKGGKSLNINLSATFGLSSSHGIKTVSSSTWKPYDAAVSLVGAGAGIWAAMKMGGASGAVMGGVPGAAIGAVGGALIAGIFKTSVGAFSFSRSHGMDEASGRTQGVNIAAGTFLVSQQATLDIRLGNYERCMVARFHPQFINNFLVKTKLHKLDFVLNDSSNDPILDRENKSDIDSLGILICSGNPKRQCLPITEKYYYMTQHFTEGDMLDTADLHNHPWLLQLRGVRDFMAFTSTVGAREVKYVDEKSYFRATMARTLNDGFAFMGGDLSTTGSSNPYGLSKEFTIVKQDSEINWPLEELSRVYFGVLPTFPGLYTFYEKQPEWPHRKPDPALSFNSDEPKKASFRPEPNCVEPPKK